MKTIKKILKALIPLSLCLYGIDQKSFLWILIGFLLICAQLFMWAYKKQNPAPTKPTRQAQIYTQSDDYIELPIAGLSFEGRIEKLKQWMNDKHLNKSGKTYGDRIYKYDRILQRGSIKLIPEPTNPHDPNAIQVVHKELGQLGYIPREETKKISKNLLARTDLVVFGGGYTQNGVEHPEDFHIRIRIYK